MLGCVGLDRTWRILSVSLSLSLLVCVPVVEKELMVVRATGQYVGAEGDGGHATEGGIVQGAPLNSIPEGNSREDKRWADANRREPPGRRSMLMARARPDGLPSPLNMYRRVLYLRSLYLRRRRRRRRRRFAFLFSPFDAGALHRREYASLSLSLSLFLFHSISREKVASLLVSKNCRLTRYLDVAPGYVQLIAMRFTLDLKQPRQLNSSEFVD